MQVRTIILLILLLGCQAQKEINFTDIKIDLLEFDTQREAEEIQEKLWQLDVEVEVQEGYSDMENRWFIELQDLEILDIEILEGDKWIRFFEPELKEKLIKVKLEL